MNCLCCCCCCCCGQASWEKEINIGFVYVNAMLKHHKPHTSVSTQTTKYDIFAAWFADSLANTNLIWVWLAKIIVYVVRFLSLVWVVCNLLINDKLPLDRQVWRAHWSSSSVRYGWEWGTFWLSAVCLALCQKFDESNNVQNVQVVGRFLGCRRAF